MQVFLYRNEHDEYVTFTKFMVKGQVKVQKAIIPTRGIDRKVVKDSLRNHVENIVQRSHDARNGLDKLGMGG